MSILGNILWFICGGLLSGLSWVLAGCLWCISIIGIPIGLQCFKFAGLAFFPFGKEVVYGGGAVSLIANIIWLIVSGIPMAVGNAVAGVHDSMRQVKACCLIAHMRVSSECSVLFPDLIPTCASYLFRLG